MSSEIQGRAVLMVADIHESGNGFHRLKFKVEGGRNRMSEVTVLISQDAHRKLTVQMARARVHTFDKAAFDKAAFDKTALLKTWARWEIAQRIQEQGFAPATITITASDLDDFGAYATDFARTLQAS